MPEAASGVPSGLGALFDSLPTGAVHVILRTPLGVWTVDPFAPPNPITDAVMKQLGVTVELRLGPLPPDVLVEPSLPQNLGWVLAAGALGVVWLITRRGRC